MLVLISFGLVLVATVLLVLGLVADSGLGLIYVSIACSLAAGIILVVATRVNRPRAETVSTGPAPLPPPEAPVMTRPAPPAPAPMVDAAPADEDFAPATQAVATTVIDDMFPIADYDDLTVGEIVPLLPKLYADEIDVVAEREEQGKARRQILARLEELAASMEGAPDDLTAEEWAEQQAPAPEPARRAPVRKAAPAKAPAKKPASATAKKATAAAKKPASATKKATAPAKKPAASATKKAAAPAKKAGGTKKAAAPAAKKAAAPTKKR